MDRSTLFDAVRDIVSKETSPSGRGMLVARLGHIITNNLPHFHWNNFGYLKLSELLGEMSSLGLLQIGRAPSGALVVWPRVAETISITTEGVSRVHRWGYTEPPAASYGRTWSSENRKLPVSVPPVSGFRRLQSEYWHIFTSFNESVRFYNKGTRAISDTAGEPASDWIAMSPITSLQQKEWANEFIKLADLSNDDELLECLANDRWYTSLIEALAVRSMPLSSAWKRYHSRKVGERAEEWCKINGIDPNNVFDEKKKETATPEPPCIPSQMIPRPTSLRDLMLIALAKASTEDLLDLKIPLRHVIEAMQPDLLKR